MAEKMMILAGGVSSRMCHSIYSANHLDVRLLGEMNYLPKGLLSIGKNSRPILYYILYSAKKAGIKDVTLVIGEKDIYFRKYLGTDIGNHYFNGLKVSFGIQPFHQSRSKPLGTADALYHGMLARPDWASNKFICVSTSHVYPVGLLRKLMGFQGDGAVIAVDFSRCQFDSSRINIFGVIHKSDKDYLIEVIEKPHPNETQKYTCSNGKLYINMSMWLFSYDMLFRYVENCPINPRFNEMLLTDAVNNMIAKYPKAVKTLLWHEHVPDLKYKDDVIPTKNYIEKYFAEN